MAVGAKAYRCRSRPAGASREVLAPKHMETLEAISANPANKVFLPFESSALMGSLGTIKGASSETTPPVLTAKGK
jgi:hypothetical protein